MSVSCCSGVTSLLHMGSLKGHQGQGVLGSLKKQGGAAGLRGAAVPALERDLHPRMAPPNLGTLPPFPMLMTLIALMRLTLITLQLSHLSHP